MKNDVNTFKNQKESYRSVTTQKNPRLMDEGLGLSCPSRNLKKVPKCGENLPSTQNIVN